MISVQDSAVLSAYVYNDAKGSKNQISKPSGWELLESGISNSPSGFTANAFQQGNEIVIAFKGTDFLFGTNNEQTVADLLADVRIGAGFGSAQLIEAVQYYQAIKTQNPNANITFTGHSLGAGLASIMSVWFGQPATVFADAPFKATSYNLDLIKSIADANWIDADLKQALYNLLVITDLPNALPGQPTQSVLLNQNEYDQRQSDITAYYVKGEVLNAVFHGIATIVGENNPIQIGGGDQVSSITLHSIILHAALKLEEQLRINTVNLPNLIPAIFDTEFYAAPLVSEDKEDFLSHILNDQIKLGYTSENGLLHQFALDASKISGGLAMENNLLNKALIAAVIEDYYFMEDGFTKAFFDKVSGGIGFDLNDINTTDTPLSDSYLVNALKDITKTDYAALGINDIRDYKWYVPTGTQTLTVKPDDGAVLMLGDDGSNQFESANGNDLLYGGNGHDRLIANGGDDRIFGGNGNDTLDGGTGTDTYYFTGNFGNDRIIDADGLGYIKLNNTTISGTTGELSGYYQDSNTGTTYVEVNGGTSLLVYKQGSQDRIVVENWQNGQLGITLSHQQAPAPAATHTGDYQKKTTPDGERYVLDDTGNYKEFGAQAGALDLLKGTSDKDAMYGLGGSDYLNGKSGDDYINGGDAGDYIQGGMGRDTLIGGGGDDLIYGSSDVDIDRPMNVDFERPVNDFYQARAIGFNWIWGNESGTPSYINGVFEGATSPSPRNRLSGDQGNIIDGGSGNDFIAAGTGADYVRGGADNDLIYGMDNGDVLFGDGGNDVIFGDGVKQNEGIVIWTLPADHGNDIIDGGDGEDILFGQGGHDVIFGGKKADRIWGDDNNIDNTPNSVHGDDYLDGGDGDDQIIGGGGNDTIYGGTGNDNIWGDDDESIVPKSDHGDDFIDGGIGIDIIYGGYGNDTIFGGADSDYLDGGAGNDYLDGGLGPDTLKGGTGNDTLVGSGEGVRNEEGIFVGGDLLEGGEGNDIYYVGTGDLVRDSQGVTTINLLSQANAENISMQVADSATQMLAVEFGDGRQFFVDDALMRGGSILYNLNDGQVEHSDLIGKALVDEVVLSTNTGFGYGGANNDILTATGNKNALLKGGDGNDQLYGSAGHDTLIGGSGADTMHGGVGNDILNGGEGTDLMMGGAGDDTYVVEDSGDFVIENASEGTDTVNSSITYTLSDNLEYLNLTGTANIDGIGNMLDNVITGNDGNNFLDGGAGNDTLIGGDGDDTLFGGAGDDRLEGGTGTNTYFMVYGMGNDVVVDTSADGGIVKLGLGVAMSDLSALRVGDDLKLSYFGINNSLLIQGYYTNTQAGWEVHDADNNVMSVQDVIDATLASSASALELARQEFVGKAKERITNYYLSGATGTDYKLGADGTIRGEWSGAPNSASIIKRSSIITKTVYRVETDNATSSSFNTTTLTWQPGVSYLYHYSNPVFAERGNVNGRIITIDEVNITSDDETIILESSVQTVREDIGLKWFRINWSTPDDWVYAGSGSIGSSTIYSYTQGTSSDSNATNLGDLIGYTIQSGSYTNLRSYSLGSFYGSQLDSQANGLRVDGAYPEADLARYYQYNTSYKIRTLNLGDSSQTVYADEYTLVNSSTGNDTIYNAGFVYGGAGDVAVYDAGVVYGGVGNLRVYGAHEVYGGSGDDFIVGMGILSGGAGNDILIGGSRLIAGSGNDRLYSGVGNTTIEIDPYVVNEVIIGGAGDSLQFLDAYYRSFGITNWQASYEHPNEYHVVEYSGEIGYLPESWFLNLEAALDYISSYFGETTEVDAFQNGYLIAPSAPLPVLIDVNGITDHLVLSAYYEGLNTPIENLSTNDFEALSPYYQDGSLGTRNVVFGEGVVLSDLQLSWGDAIGSISGTGAASIYTTLDITWGTNNQVVRVMIPRSDDPLGSGVTKFTFLEDNSEVNLTDLISIAPPAPSFDQDSTSIIFGTDDSDELYGDGGDITLIGLNGDDYYYVDSVGDVVVENFNGGYDAIQSSVTYTLPDHVEDLYLTGSDNINATGNDLDNSIEGNDGSNVLIGGLGNDEIYSYKGNDTLIGGEGSDTYYFDLYGDAGDANVINELGNSSADNDVIEFYDVLPEDIVLQKSQDDLVLIYGDENSVSITGWYLADSNTVEQIIFIKDVFDANGNYVETIQITWDNATLIAMAPDGGNVGEQVTGTVANEILVGTSGNDIIDGLAGADTMSGGMGDDTYFVDRTSDKVIENDNEGVDTINSTVTYTLPDFVENLNLLGTSSIKATGNSQDNVLTGNAGNNTLDGKAGQDTMIGGAGNDIYIVDDEGDQVIEMADEGTDAVHASVSFTLRDHIERLTLTGEDNINGTGNALNNVLIGNAGNNTLIGGEGNDTLDGKAGIDTLIGGLGNDTYTVDHEGDVVIEFEDEGVDTVRASVSYTLSENVERLTLTGEDHINGTGNALNNVLIGNAGNNTLLGGDGNDTLDGKAGVDTLIGGLGNDTYTVDHEGDVIIENGDEGTDTVRASISYTLGDHVERLTLLGAENINATGNDLNNILTGNVGNNTLTGGLGNDTLNGREGADTLVGGEGNDTYIVDHENDVIIELENEGTDTVRASVSYTLSDHVERLTLLGASDLSATGNQLNNILTGNSGNNFLYGLDGNDTLDGKAGQDVMIGGVGDDVYVVDDTGDMVIELADEGGDTVKSSISYTLGDHLENLTMTGTDQTYGIGNSQDNKLTGNVSSNYLYGLAGNDVISGNAGNDVLQGGDGDDTINGYVGNDLLDGGAGNDRLNGSHEHDFFAGGIGNDIINAGTGSDVIAFNFGDGNDILSSSIGTDNTLSLGGGINYDDLMLRKSGNSLILKVGAGENITIQNWYNTNNNYRSIATLQVIAEAMADFDANGSDTLLDNKIETFDFTGLVDAFDQARAGDTTIASWSLSDALLDFHLSGSDAEAIGGDLAYQYGVNGSLAGMGLNAAQGVMGAVNFGQSAQTLNAPSTWQNEAVKLA